MSSIKPERCDDEVVVYVGDYEVNHSSMRWLGHITMEKIQYRALGRREVRLFR